MKESIETLSTHRVRANNPVFKQTKGIVDVNDIEFSLRLDEEAKPL